MPTVLDEYDYRFELGKAAELRTGRDVVLISTGLMTMRALQAAARLEADHVDVAVLHVPTIKPLDTEAILRAARTDRLVVTLENHTVIGGLSESVASTLAFAGAGTRVVPIALPDEFLAAGALPTLHDRYGLSTDAIVARVRSELGSASGTGARDPPAPVRPTACSPGYVAAGHPTTPTHSWRRPMSLSDKTAVITGAGSKRGIGRATAHTLAAAGWNVAILDLDEGSAKDAAHEIAERHGVQAVGIGCDVTDEASVDNALAVLAGPGTSRGCPRQQRRHHLADAVPRGHRRGVGPHLRGERPWCLQRHPAARPGHGRARLRPHRVPLVGLGRTGRRRLRWCRLLRGQGRRARLHPGAGPRAGTPRRDGERRRPGLIDTDITGGALEGERKTQLVAGIPVGRNGPVADVADLITYLCREQSGYITGATYDVNGGAHIH